MMSYRWKRMALVLLLVGWTVTSATGVRAQKQSVRIEEFWEDLNDIFQDDEDGENPTVLASDSAVQSAVLDDIDPVSETPIRVLSGSVWGAYNSAQGVSGSATGHGILIVNNEDQLRAGSQKNSFLSFVQHSDIVPGDFPEPYTAETGSYIYSLLGKTPGCSGAIDITNGVFKMAVSVRFTRPVDVDAQSFRLLIQVGGSKWYRSTSLISIHRNILLADGGAEGDFGTTNSNNLTKDAREALLKTHTIASITGWERVSAGAEAEMNSPDDGGEVALGSAATPDPNPDLTQVTGWGILIDQLAEGASLILPNGVNILGMVLTGEQTVSFSEVAQTTLEDAAASVDVRIRLGSPATAPIQVTYSTLEGTATPDKDYVPVPNPVVNGTVDFAVGECEKIVTIGILPDNIDEPDESFSVTLSSTSATFVGGDHTITISDDDTAPTISIEASDAGESAGSATVVVSLSNPSAFAISVDFATVDGTATAGLDYTAGSGTLAFTPDGPMTAPDTALQIPITILNDAFDEDDRETFSVNLTNAQGPVVLNPDPLSVQVGIGDDDSPPTVRLTAASQTVNEPDGAVVSVPIDIVLSQSSGRDYTVRFEVTPISATPGADYDPAAVPPSQVTFARGFPDPAGGETIKTVMVQINPDDIDELNETLSFSLTSATTDNASGAPGPLSDPPLNLIFDPRTQTITINDNDPPPTVSIASAAQSVDEDAGVVTIEVQLSGVSAKFVTVDLETLDGTANAGTDYSAVREQFVFAPGELSKSVDIAIEDDDIYGYLINDALALEKDFTLRISNPLSLQGATNTNPPLGIDVQTITINENESIPSLAFATDSQIVVEGDDDAAHVDITVSGTTVVPITFSVATMDDLATQPMDYIGEFGTRFIPPLEMTTDPIWIPIVNDPFTEGPETFLVVLSNAAGAVIDPAGDAHTVTIMDDSEMDLLTKTIFCETWDNVAAPLGLPVGPVALSDEDFEALEGFSAIPLGNVRFASVGSSTRIQRIEFGADAPGLSGSRAFGNSLKAPLATLEGGPLDDDRVNSITLEARVFIGALTPVGSVDFPTTADIEVATLATFTFTIGDSTGGDAMMTLPAALGAAGSLGFQLNNNEWGQGGTISRLIFTINDPTMGLAANLGVATSPHSAFVGAPEGIGQALQATSSAVFASSGEEYIIGATFIKKGFNSTDVEYYMRPVDGSANVSTNGVAGPITIPSSFPFNGVIDQAAINLGAGFGLGDGLDPGISPLRDGNHQGSWVDDLKVRTFGIKAVQQLAASSWPLYE